MRSLRRTLAVRFAGTMLLGLLAIACWDYVGVRRTLREQLDQSLRSAAQLQLDDLRLLGTLPAHVRPADMAGFIREVNRLVVLRDSAGAIIAVNTELARRLPLDTASFGLARAGGTVLATAHWSSGDVRSIYAPARSPATAAVLQVGTALEPLDAASRSVRNRLIGTALLGALATFVGAGWLANSSVTPVAAIAAQAQAITGKAAGERITAHADIAELEGLVHMLNDMLARLERAQHWHRQIIRDLGHDLRTPITAMRAGVEVALSTERKPDQYRRVLGSMLEEIDRLALISDALVLLGRLESGELKPHVAVVDARSIANVAVTRVRNSMGARVFTLSCPREAVPLHGDARLLTMVLDQLLDNAMRHTPPGTKVDVTVRRTDGGVELVVEDDGPGVSEEMLPRLFERFYRGDVARGRDGGPGLGLTAAAAIVELHHGTIRAERASTGGLRIRTTLPSTLALAIEERARAPA